MRQRRFFFFNFCVAKRNNQFSNNIHGILRKILLKLFFVNDKIAEYVMNIVVL